MKWLSFVFFIFFFSLNSEANCNVKVKGMVCSSCAHSIEAKLKKNESIKDVVVDVKTGQVKIEFKENQDVVDAEIKKSIEDLGYTVVAVSR